MTKTYTESDYASIIAGDVVIPNFEPVTLEYFCDALASGGHSMIPKWGHGLDKHGRRTWAHYFLTNYSNMGSAPDGSGYVAIYGSGKPTVGRFAICKHEKQMGLENANPSRGYHPGHCVKCGLSMFIDSGD